MSDDLKTISNLMATCGYLIATYVPWPVRNYAEGCPYADVPRRYEAARLALGIPEPVWMHPGNQPTERGPAKAPAPYAWVPGDTVETVLARIAAGKLKD